MKQLTLGDILDFVNELKKEGIPLKGIRQAKIYIGDDEELNGIHEAFYIEPCDNYAIELIKENSTNKIVTGINILIS